MTEKKPTLEYGRPPQKRYPWWGIAAVILFVVLTVGVLIVSVVSALQIILYR